MPQRQEISIKFSFWGTSLTQAVGKTNSDFFVCFLFTVISCENYALS